MRASYEFVLFFVRGFYRAIFEKAKDRLNYSRDIFIYLVSIHTRKKVKITKFMLIFCLSF